MAQLQNLKNLGLSPIIPPRRWTWDPMPYSRLYGCRPQGPRTEQGLRMNIYVGILYLEAWLGGNGCIPVNYLMEDAATAEIGRTQVRNSLRPSVGCMVLVRDIPYLRFDKSF